ncbi:MAG: hypothetical protein QM790_11720 [Nibricoccus sp.]
MFEISGDDIVNLSDPDLRSLVKRLAIAELRSRGCPLSSVTTGGHQDAADGGIDVRVDCPTEIVSPDFVPSRLTGYQVKKHDMSAGAIEEEMRPKNFLRSAIRALAQASGSYVIVSAAASVTDSRLTDRKNAMRHALHDLPCASQLHTDFYDRDRLSNWVNEYPGAIAWVRERVGRSLSGWSGVGDWEGPTDGKPKPYLLDETACLIDERSCNREPVTIAKGIVNLRAALSTPQTCIRLIGLSGLGKTRLVQALFEESVGKDPLDPSLAVYTDYSAPPNPTARDMARDLVARGQRAILVVDNCNPETHSELARLCAANASKVSLLTVEYDVRDDEPERTEVFRLQSVSPELVTEWLKQNFPDISQIDRERVAEFSGGNFRVAGVLAGTVHKGETLGSLKDRALFQRIFHQGRSDPDQHLLHAAEDLSLLYSIDGADVSDEGELARVATIREISAQVLYEKLVELRDRGVVQARGKFRAILPQAIANPLAAYALKRIPPANFDEFCAALTPRMLKSVSRRLGYLHDSTDARAAVARWLRSDGPLGNLIEEGESGFQIITNIAPVAPEMVLTMLEREINGPNGPSILAPGALNRYQWVRLIKALSYDSHMFERAMRLLIRFLTVEPEGNNLNSARHAFGELFHIYLSGTLASPAQRRASIKTLATSDDAALRSCALIALDALLETNQFMSTAHFDFGARSRDWGWEPKINRDIWDWFNEAIALAIELAPYFAEVREILARHARSLWGRTACHEALDRAATTFIQERPWIEGWKAFKGAMHYDGQEMPEEIRFRLAQIINRLKPTDLLHQARAIVLGHLNAGWDFEDGEEGDGNTTRPWEKASKMAQEMGKSLVNETAIHTQFIAELLVAQQSERAFECGRGLAEGATDIKKMWCELATAYQVAEPSKRDATVLGGFIYQAHQRDSSVVSHLLEMAIENPDLAPRLPYLQARAGIDAEGIARLQRAIRKGVLVAYSFRSIANGVVSDSPSEPLAELLKDIAQLSDGIEVALEILHMHFYCRRRDELAQHPALVQVGRDLLVRTDFGKKKNYQDSIRES